MHHYLVSVYSYRSEHQTAITPSLTISNVDSFTNPIMARIHIYIISYYSNLLKKRGYHTKTSRIISKLFFGILSVFQQMNLPSEQIFKSHFPFTIPRHWISESPGSRGDSARRNTQFIRSSRWITGLNAFWWPWRRINSEVFGILFISISDTLLKYHIFIVHIFFFFQAWKIIYCVCYDPFVAFF